MMIEMLRRPRQLIVPHAIPLALAACVTAGVVLRATALHAWWPVAPRLVDPVFYVHFAVSDPFASPLHPAGYSLFLALVASLTRSVEVVIVAQHAMGILAGLALFVAVRRLCGSPWPALVAAATVLLGADQIFLEHTVMSETLFVLLLSLTMYAAARALEAADRWWPWPMIAAVLVVGAGVTRVAGLFAIPVIAVALFLAAPRPWSERWRSVAAFTGTAAVLLLAYGQANMISHGRFEIAPTTGYHLYGRVAPFADCGEFEPPPGTRRLCERVPPADRDRVHLAHPYYYLFGWDSPAIYLMGREALAPIFNPARRHVTPATLDEAGRTLNEHDDLFGAFARQAALHHPVAYAEAMWIDLRSYFLPGTADGVDSWRFNLSPALDWTTPPELPVTEKGMELQFTPFAARRDRESLGLLRDYQRVFRFGATALTIATLLILIGLFTGPRRNRIAVLVLGGTGLAMLILPTLSVAYVARYTVPFAGVLAAGAAVALLPSARRARAAWRRAPTERAG